MLTRNGNENMRSPPDPYHDRKKYHMAKAIRDDGAVSPLCAKTPRRLNLSRELWTLEKEAVTCKRCLVLLNGETS